MVITDPSTTATIASDGRRPRPGAGVRAELAETAAGWTLSLHCDAATAVLLRAAGADVLGPNRLNVSITPNLVPGEPFAVDTVLIVDETNQPD